MKRSDWRKLQDHTDPTKLAQWLDQTAIVVAPYAALDAVNLFYSVAKPIVDLIVSTGADPNLFHNWLLTPSGILITIIGSLSLVILAILGNKKASSSSSPHELKTKIIQFLNDVWPYIRKSIKAFKNSYKGIRGLLSVISNLDHKKYSPILIPVILPFAILSILNQIISLKYVIEPRKAKMKISGEYLKYINEYTIGNNQTLDAINQYFDKEYTIGNNQTLDAINQYFDKEYTIEGQSLANKRLGLISSLYAAAIDGMYLYLGVFGLSLSLSAPFFIAVLSITSIFYTLCILTRTSEENDFINKLEINLVKIEILKTKKRLQLLFNSVGCNNFSYNDLEKIKVHCNKLQELVNQLQNMQRATWWSVMLAGAKEGLVLYSAINAFFLAFNTMAVLYGAVMPPILLLTGVALGAMVSVFFMIYRTIQRNNNKSVENNNIEDKIEEFIKKQDVISAKSFYSDNMEAIKRNLESRASLTSIKDKTPAKIFEIIRSFFSGLWKGQKTATFALNPLLKNDHHGHYVDTTPILVVGIILGVIHSLIFALRALAKEFGRKAIDDPGSNSVALRA